jgi:hypothetical protein
MMMWLIDAIVPGGGGVGGGGVGGGGGEGGLVGGGFPVPGFGVLELAPQPEVSTTKKAQSVNCNTQKARALLDTTAISFRRCLEAAALSRVAGLHNSLCDVAANLGPIPTEPESE